MVLRADSRSGANAVSIPDMAERRKPRAGGQRSHHQESERLQRGRGWSPVLLHRKPGRTGVIGVPDAIEGRLHFA